MAIREHLPSARELATWPAVQVMKLGHGAMDAAHRLKKSRDIAQLDFHGRHALEPGSDQKTIYEVGVGLPVFPVHHPPKHGQASEKDLTTAELKRIKKTAPYYATGLYNHKDLIDEQLQLEGKQK